MSGASSSPQVEAVPALRDNYIWLIHGLTDPGRVAIVDPGDAAPVKTTLAARQLSPVAVLLTHHHPDHTAGAPALHEHFGIPVYGPREAAATGAVLADGEQLDLPALGLRFAVLAVPGHTAGHIAYAGHQTLFCGDTLFSAGCGRLFEGTAAQLHASLQRLAALPADTAVYCGHEYTEANLRFARVVEPDNAAITAYLARCAARPAGVPSLPSSIGLERQINVFLRTAEPGVRQAAADWLGKPLDGNVATFAALRKWKDSF